MRLIMDETPEQRKVIDAQVADGLAEIREGRVSKRFDTVGKMLESLKGSLPKKPRKAARTSKSRRREKTPS
jgi:hypothetical protein